MSNDLTQEEIRRIVQETLHEQGTMTRNDVRQIVREAVQETLLSLGVDAQNPLGVQQDMHFVRELRGASAMVQKRGLVILMGILITALCGAIWIGISSALGRS